MDGTPTVVGVGGVVAMVAMVGTGPAAVCWPMRVPTRPKLEHQGQEQEQEEERGVILGREPWVAWVEENICSELVGQVWVRHAFRSIRR